MRVYANMHQTCMHTNNVFLFLLDLFTYFMYVYRYVGASRPREVHRGQRTACGGGQFSLPNVWFLGTELRLSGLVVRASTHGAILLAHNLSFQKTLQKMKSLSSQ